MATPTYAMDLHEAYQAALLQDATTRAARAAVQASDERINQAKALQFRASQPSDLHGSDRVYADLALDADPVFGPFRAEKDAWRALEGKAREAGLCLKTLGLEAGAGSCFAYQVRKCRGACIGKEPRALHDARLQMALVPLKFKPSLLSAAKLASKLPPNTAFS